MKANILRQVGEHRAQTSPSWELRICQTTTPSSRKTLDRWGSDQDGEVIKTDNGRSYTVRTPHGTLIQRNRVQLKPATAPPTFLRPQAALNPATVATTAYPALAPNPLKRAEVHPQSEQQTAEQSNTTAEDTQEPTLKDPEPRAVSSSPLTQTRSGRTIKSPQDCKTMSQTRHS